MRTTSFSLFNAMQILCIAIGKDTGGESYCVFVVLIVHIVTLCLSEATSFSLINVVQILYPQNKNRPSVCGDFKPSSFMFGLFYYMIISYCTNFASDIFVNYNTILKDTIFNKSYAWISIKWKETIA